MPDANDTEPSASRSAAATHPAPRRQVPSARMYCPVAGCPQSNPLRAAGWACNESLRNHVQEHAYGRLAGEIPRSWMEERNLNQCSVCSRLISTRFGGACPRCRPEVIAGTAQQAHGRAIPADWPSLEDVCSVNIPTRKYIPKGARKAWGECLSAALSQVHVYNDERAWIDLIGLPKMVLRASERGGSKLK